MNKNYLCENCLYFIQYYSLGRCKLHKANCGTCKKILRTVTPTDIKYCEHFTPKLEKIEKQNNNVLAIDMLKYVENALIDLKTYLENQN